MDLQLHVGASELREIEPVTNFIVKPRGGFWTSTWDGEGSQWIEAAISMKLYDDIEQQPMMLLRPRPDSRIYTIDSQEDLNALMVEHHYELFPGCPIAYLNFEKLSEKYDAIHLTDEGQWRTRHSFPNSLMGWDCESTLWFRQAFDFVKSVVPVR